MKKRPEFETVSWIELFNHYLDHDPESADRFMAQVRIMHHSFTGNIVTAFKRLLGRQARCFDNGRRHFVWENVDLGWRVYVHNDAGIALEFKAGLTVPEMQAAWNSLQSLLNLTGATLPPT